MQVKVCPILIIAMFLLLMVMPTAAYDYRGVPKPGDNYPENSTEESVAGEAGLNLENLDFSALFDSPELTNLILLVIGFFLQLFGGASS